MMNWILASVILMLSSPVFAHVGADHDSCQGMLIGKVKFVPSGRESEAFAKFKVAVQEYLKPGGIFERLGIDVPPQVLNFMQGADVNAVGSINGFAVSHWHDGQRLSRGRSGLLYEIVIPGKDEHHGIYRDDLSFEELMSIFFHATAGHNFFSHNSRYPHFRSSNRIQESYELAHYMDKVRLEVGGDEVSLWYQYLLSLDYAQDFLTAQYQLPEELKVKAPKPNPFGKTNEPEGFTPTRNVLQGLVANLPADMPEWKKEMARRFEQLHRFSPGMANTKIMNEGFSTFMQIMLPKHGQHNTFEDGIHYCCLLSGVARKDLSNPYYLGLEGWKNVYARFMKRPDVAALQTIEAKDAAFIRYAKKQIIGVMNDEMFLKYALDDQWVVKENLAMTRPLTEEEVREKQMRGENLQPPDPNDPKKNWPMVILTRNPKEIVKALVVQQKGFHYQFAMPQLTTVKDKTDARVALELNDPVGRIVALDTRSLVETLLVLTQIMEKPVSIESTVELEETPPEPAAPDDGWPYYYRPPVQPVLRKTRIMVTASPDGTLRAYEVFRNKSSAPESVPANDAAYDPRIHTPEYQERPVIAAALKPLADGYIYNLTIEQQHMDEQQNAAMFRPSSTLAVQEGMVNSILAGASVSLQLGMPTAPRAITEYQNLLQRRLGAILKDAIRGKGPLIRRPDGVRIVAMPTIPWFRFDQNSLNATIENGPKVPAPQRLDAIARLGTQTASPHPFRPGDFHDIGPVAGREGDIGWGPKPGQGQGEGEGEEPGGTDPSEEGGEREFEHISLDDYADAMGEEITLPNLRPKPGMDRNKEDEMSGRRTRQTGVAVNRQIARNAFRRGFPTQEEIEEGANPYDPSGILRRGMGRLRKETDWVVRDFEVKPSPDLNAVVFFKMDMSGSMDWYKKVAKQIVYDMRAILKRKYKNVTFVFITFNDKAYVFDNEKDFFAFKPNGGTRYATGFRKTLELHENYPANKWDRFSVVVGDLDETYGPEEKQSFDELKEASQYIAVVRTHTPPTYWDELANYFKGEAAGDEFVGYLDVIPPESYAPIMFRTLFKNDPKQ